jgi:hypothetical protein
MHTCDLSTDEKCGSSLIQVGVFGIFTIIYLIFLFFVSLFVIVYGLQNGFSNVHILDMIFAIGYLFVLILVFIGGRN